MMNLTARRRYLLSLGGINVFILLCFYSAYRHIRAGIPSGRVAFLPHREDYADAFRLAANTASTANIWSPLVLSTCLFGMPSYYAPCFAQRLAQRLSLPLEGENKGVPPDENAQFVYAEELVYPDFELREPYFVNETQREVWRTFVKTDAEFQDRAGLHGNWVAYRGQKGQNFVFHNVKYTPRLGQDSWIGEACMSRVVNTAPIEPLPSGVRDASLLPTALIALSPDSYSFQHFLDRVTHILVQGAHLYNTSVARSAAPYVLTGSGGSKTVNEMWERMGFSPDHVLHHSESVAAAQLVFSCRAVLVHPWLSLKTLEFLGVDGYRDANSTKRNKVVYMSRSDGRTSNDGRRVMNEKEVLQGITEYLTERNQGEELVMFNPDAFQNITELFSWFAENVMAVVGPHGGAMINHRWAHKDTFVLEFMPSNRVATMIFEEASLLSQTYAAIVVPPTRPDGFDMEIEVESVVGLLRKHLGIVGENPLRRSYYWGSQELGFR